MIRRHRGVDPPAVLPPERPRGADRRVVYEPETLQDRGRPWLVDQVGRAETDRRDSRQALEDPGGFLELLREHGGPEDGHVDVVHPVAADLVPVIMNLANEIGIPACDLS